MSPYTILRHPKRSRNRPTLTRQSGGFFRFPPLRSHDDAEAARTVSDILSRYGESCITGRCRTFRCGKESVAMKAKSSQCPATAKITAEGEMPVNAAGWN